MKSKDLTIVGLVFILLIQFGVSIKNSYHLNKLSKELNDTVQVVYWLNDKLDNSYMMIDSLNEEITNNWNELSSYKHLEKLKKDLDRSN